MTKDQAADAAFGPWPEASEDVQLFRVEARQLGYELVTQADARALWSVRVLDAWACLHDLNGWASSVFGEGPVCVLYEGRVWLTPDKLMHRYDGATVDAARHAAALAVYPTLPADVRAKLGECP